MNKDEAFPSHNWTRIVHRSEIATGLLMCGVKTKLECVARVTQLFNGQVWIELRLRDIPNLNLLAQRKVVSFQGRTDNGDHIEIDQIYVTNVKINLSDEFLVEGKVYESGVEVERRRGVEPASLRVETTNLHLFGESPQEFHVRDYSIRLGQTPKYKETRSFNQLFKTACIGGTLQFIPFAGDDLEDVNVLCSLLSWAQRSYISPTAIAWLDETGEILRYRLQPPEFTFPVNAHPLVPPTHLADFLGDCFKQYFDGYWQWRLGEVLDHYLHAMSVRSAWPLAVSLFTALEALQSAYKHHSDDDTPIALHVPKADFGAVIEPTLSLLEDNFDAFRKLNESERETVVSKLHKINERSYRAVLTSMLSELGLQYDEAELSSLLRLRNDIVHTGRPRYKQQRVWRDAREALKQVQKVGSLLERIVLRGILDYRGEFNSFASIFKH